MKVKLRTKPTRALPSAASDNPTTGTLIDKKSWNPEVDGVSYSSINYWLACREKGRLQLEGYRKVSQRETLTFGTIAHRVLELTYGVKTPVTEKLITKLIAQAEKEFIDGNPKADAVTLEGLELACAMAEAVMPSYFKHWAKRDAELTWVGVEHRFKIPVTVTVNGETIDIPINGILDGAFTAGPKKQLHLFETKTKSRWDEGTLIDIVPIDLQCNMYLWALMTLTGKTPKGITYNLIRRPQLRRSDKESLAQFAKRMRDDVVDRPEFYFSRITSTVEAKDIVAAGEMLQRIVQDIVNWRVGLVPHYRNSGSCHNGLYPCDFLAICSRGEMDTFTKLQRDRTRGKVMVSDED